MLRGDVTPRERGIAFMLVVLVGISAAALVGLGNPGNMGLCGACFLRDVAGSTGFLSGGGPKIFRPELLGLVLGALFYRAARRQFGARSGSFAATRFFLGVWMGIGALVFLGCPFRMLQRLGGGDLNAVIGLLGFVVGVGAALALERRGYHVGKTSIVPAPVGLVGPMLIVLLFGLFLTGLLIGPGPGDTSGPPHAPWLASLALALLAGAILSATGFCAVSAARQVFQRRRPMLLAAAVLVLAYGVTLSILGRSHFGFAGQPAAHQDGLWNALSMVLVGMTGALAGGCPVRQIVMTGEGNGDAFAGVMGILVGGAAAHGLGLASTAAGPTEAGRVAVIIGLGVTALYGTSIVRLSKASP